VWTSTRCSGSRRIWGTTVERSFDALLERARKSYCPADAMVYKAKAEDNLADSDVWRAVRQLREQAEHLVDLAHLQAARS